MIIRLALLALLCAAPLTAQAQTLTDEQKTEVEALVKKIIAENPQLILDSVEKLRTSQAEAELAGQRQSIIDFRKSLGKDFASFSAGNPKGDVTIVEFFDYNCGYCKKAFEEVNALIEADKNVNVVFFEMPILGPQSTEAAKWSIAAAKQGKYFDFHRAAMMFTGPKSDENLLKVAEKAGLDIKKAQKVKEDPETMHIIDANVQIAQKLGFSGTPGFIIGDRPVFGYMDLDSMKAAVEDARKADAGTTEKSGD